MKRLYDEETARSIVVHQLAEYGIKRNAVARRAGISIAHLSRVLKGRVKLTDNLLLRLQEVLKLKFYE